jgi:TPP-dependent pyruvate/acetoin dehydrogenase alpha subunit
MLTLRMARERARQLVQNGKISHLCCGPTGSEAIEVGATVELQADDTLATYGRDVLTRLVKGLPLKQAFIQLKTSAEPGSRGLSSAERVRLADLKLLPSTSTIGAQLDLAAGVAFANGRQKNSNVVVALCGDAFTALGSWHESAKIAGEYRLPMLFVVEAPRWDVSRQSQGPSDSGDLRDRSQSYGFPGITVDGDDVVAIYRVVQESIHRARGGAGPTLIECKTSVRPTGSVASSATNGRSRKTSSSSDHDPLEYMEHYLRKRKAWQDDWKQHLLTQLSADINVAVEGARLDR